MKILGIESSCDETAAAVVEDGRRLLSNVVHSQIDIHREYGGVVPEVAARSHIEMVLPVIKKALREANCTWDDIDAIAVTYAPGLVGSLLVGSLTARTLALIKNKPLYAIHHVTAHVYANFIVENNEEGIAPPLAPEMNSTAARHPLKLARNARTETQDFDVGRSPESSSRDSAFSAERDKTNQQLASSEGDSKGHARLTLPHHQPTFPMLALIVSGGHTQLALFRSHSDFSLLGQTQDDAVGEAFDKVAKILGLPYPGGPSIAAAAEHGNPNAHTFPKAQFKCTHGGAHTGMERQALSSSGAKRTDSYDERAAQDAAPRSAPEVCHHYDFSFSGLKTAVLRAVQGAVGKDFTFPSHELPGLLSDSERHDFAASFQKTAIETLVDKTEAAFRDFSPASVVIAGGVAANQELRRQLSARLPIAIEYAPMQLCTDNAAMIAALAYYDAQDRPADDPYGLEVQPSLSMTA